MAIDIPGMLLSLDLPALIFASLRLGTTIEWSTLSNVGAFSLTSATSFSLLNSSKDCASVFDRIDGSWLLDIRSASFWIISIKCASVCLANFLDAKIFSVAVGMSSNVIHLMMSAISSDLISFVTVLLGYLMWTLRKEIHFIYVTIDMVIKLLLSIFEGQYSTVVMQAFTCMLAVYRHLRGHLYCITELVQNWTPWTNTF